MQEWLAGYNRTLNLKSREQQRTEQLLRPVHHNNRWQRNDILTAPPQPVPLQKSSSIQPLDWMHPPLLEW